MTANPKTQLKKILTRHDVMALAFGAMIGWGWVVLSGEMIDKGGTLGSILAFVVGGLMAIMVGLVYAELTSAIPRAGGELAFSFRALNPTLSWICGWFLCLAYVAITAFEAAALSTVIRYLFPDATFIKLYSVAGWDVDIVWIAVGIIGALFIGFVNYIGIRQSAIFQTIGVACIFVVGIALFLGSGFQGSNANMEPLFNGWSGFFAVVIMTPFMFIGFDVIPQTSEEMRIPAKAVGRLILFSVAMAATWYILVQLSVGRGLSAARHATAYLPTADAMGAVFNSDIAAKILILGGLAGILTSWNAFLIGASRLLFAMGRSKMIPPFFGRVHPKHRTPSNAIIFITALSAIAPFFGRQVLVWIVDASGLATVIAYMFVVVSFIALRIKEPRLERPYKIKNAKLVGTIAVLLVAFYICLYMPGSPSALIWPNEWIIILAWIVLGAVFILFMRGRFGDREEQAKFILGEQEAGQRRKQ